MTTPPPPPASPTPVAPTAAGTRARWAVMAGVVGVALGGVAGALLAGSDDPETTTSERLDPVQRDIVVACEYVLELPPGREVLEYPIDDPIAHRFQALMAALQAAGRAGPGYETWGEAGDALQRSYFRVDLDGLDDAWDDLHDDCTDELTALGRLAAD
ncbi:MAG: hypothetical protein ACK5OX_06145 [Desertimonas sp.]